MTTGTNEENEQQSSTSNNDEEAAPVFMQYIEDRVNGNSYVPRESRKPKGKMSWFSCGCCVRCCCEKKKESPSTATASDDNNTDDNNNNNNRTISDYKDFTQRPPHYCCYVAPCVRRWPWFFERNWFCRCTGAIGGCCCFDTGRDGKCQHDAEQHRKEHIRRRRIFSIGLTFNGLALICTIIASMAFTREYGLLRRTSFTRGEAKVLVLPHDADNDTEPADRVVGGKVLQIDVGFRAVAVENLISNTKDVFWFDNFCEDWDNDPFISNNTTQAVYEGVEDLLAESVCGECRQSSEAFVVSCIFNLFIIIKNMLSDVTRMYPRYDLNCPNFYGSLMATLSVFLGLYTASTYRSRCFDNISQDLEQGRWDDQDLEVAFDWRGGPGFICLVVATFLRVVDMICNYCVPTPSITRRRKEQQQYEVDYGPVREQEQSQDENAD